MKSNEIALMSIRDFLRKPEGEIAGKEWTE